MSNSRSHNKHSHRPTSIHHGQRSRDGHHRHQDAQSSASQPTSSTAPTFSFLFVVNTLELSDSHYERDEWGVMMPPTETTGYVGEGLGPVFRYQDNEVTRVPEHCWYRNWGQEGGVVSGWTEPDGPIPSQPINLPSFATYTVFRGWKYRPIMFMRSDATVHNVNISNLDTMYHGLSFRRRAENPSVSEAGERENLYAAGRDASWMGKLVPNSFENPNTRVERSGGLAGSLPLILGLMALSQPKGHEAEAFDPGNWRRDRTWHGPTWTFRDRDCQPGPDDPPRGVLVHVCCDEVYNRDLSTVDWIKFFEEHGIIVAG